MYFNKYNQHFHYLLQKQMSSLQHYNARNHTIRLYMCVFRSSSVYIVFCGSLLPVRSSLGCLPLTCHMTFQMTCQIKFHMKFHITYHMSCDMTQFWYRRICDNLYGMYGFLCWVLITNRYILLFLFFRKTCSPKFIGRWTIFKFQWNLLS